MAVSIIQQKSTAGAGPVSSITLTFASTATAGSTLVVFANGDNVTGPAPAGWTAVTGSPAAGFCDNACFYKQNAAGTETSVTCTQTGIATGFGLYFYELGGAVTSGGPNTQGVVNSAADVGGTMTGPALTTTNANTIILACHGEDNGGPFDTGMGGGFTFDGGFASTGTGTLVSLNVGHQIVAAIGTYTPTWTNPGGNTNDAVIAVAFAAAPTGPVTVDVDNFSATTVLSPLRVPTTTATPVAAAAGATSATVAFTPNPDDGGAVVDTYRATPRIGGVAQTTTSGASSPVTVTGLTTGTTYTFTVVAHNSVGFSAESAVSNSVTPVAITVPGPPTGVSAAAGNASATVTWVIPASNGGAAIIDYTASARVGGVLSGQTATIGGATATSTTVNGLTNATAYTFTVTARNSVGSSAASVASAPVTPVASSFPDLTNRPVYTSGDNTLRWKDASGTPHSQILTLQNPAQDTTADDQIIQNLHIVGQFFVKHKRVIIRNCFIEAVTAPMGGHGFLIDTFSMSYTGRADNLLITDCELKATGTVGIGGDLALIGWGRFTATRCNFHTITGDVLKMDQGSTIQDSYIWDIRENGLAPPNDTHNDGIQHDNQDFVNDIVIVRNSIDNQLTQTSCISFEGGAATFDPTLIVTDNLINSPSSCRLQFGDNGVARAHGAQFKRNHFGTKYAHSSTFTNQCYSDWDWPNTGPDVNVYDGNGSIVLNPG